jgi:hypothetical protein
MVEGRKAEVNKGKLYSTQYDEAGKVVATFHRSNPLRRPGYREAVEWLAGNDDCHWLGDSGFLSVSAAMVRDLWDVPQERLCADLARALKRVFPDHPALRNARG